MASPVAGQPVTDTATVTPSPRSAGTPTGSVSFTDDDNPVAGCQSLPLPAVAPLRVQCTETFGSGATHAIVATYSGDPDDAGSTASLQQTVGQTPTQTSVTTSTPGITYGQTALIVATVTPAGGAAVSPGGTVTFSDWSAPLATVNVSTAGGVASASLDTSDLVEGPHQLTATYSGDPTFATSTTTGPVTVDVAEAATTVTVASASAQSVVGQTVVFTASIASSVPGATGTIQFDDNGSLIGSGAVSGGQATFQTSSLALGAHPITAIYEGDDNFVGGSSSNTVMQTVVPASDIDRRDQCSRPRPGRTDHRLQRDGRRRYARLRHADGHRVVQRCGEPNTHLPGPGAPCRRAAGGHVRTGVRLDRHPERHGELQRRCELHHFGGRRDGDASSPVSTTTALVSSPSASTSGQAVTLTATVTPTSGAANPDGTVSFTLNGVPLGDSVLSTTDGVSSASMLLTTLPIGSDSVSASYEGDPSFLASASTAAAPVTVTRAPTTLGLLGSTDPSTGGPPMTLTATVFPATGSGESGTVTFFDDGTPIGTGTVSNGQATLTLPTLPAGDDAITADYSGDADFIASSTPTPLLPAQ